MSLRWIVAVIAASALLLSGCGSSKAPAPSAAPKSSSAESSSAESTAEQSSSDEAGPVQTLDPSACTDLTGANLDLAVATNADDAKKAADVFAKYNPPPDVQEAVDHFVQTKGAQFDDPDFDKYNSAIDNWVKAVCPL